MKRKPIRKSVRFEVFKRDSFTCQYCGRKAPDVVLEVDHITPVAVGGENEILNLVSSCRDCNAGKSDRLLSDTAAIDKRRDQLEDLEERRQQLQMLHDWHVSLIDLDDQAVSMAESLWYESLGEPGCRWTVPARDEMRKVIRKNGFSETCEAIREAAESALRSSEISDSRDEVTNEWFWKIGTVAAVRRWDQEEPGVRRLLYIRGICRNRMRYCPQSECLELLRRAFASGVGLDWMESTAKQCTSWNDWESLMEDAIQTQELSETGGNNG